MDGNTIHAFLLFGSANLYANGVCGKIIVRKSSDVCDNIS